MVVLVVLSVSVLLRAHIESIRTSFTELQTPTVQPVSEHSEQLSRSLPRNNGTEQSKKGKKQTVSLQRSP